MELLSSDLKHLFVNWMEELAVEAAIKNSRAALGINQALERLRKHQDPINKPGDLLKIQYFGEKRVEYLKKKLKQYCQNEGFSVPKEFATPQAALGNTIYHSSQESPLKTKKTATKKATSTRKYVPAKRSGGYAILMVLAKYDQDRHGLTKDEISKKAGPYCDKSFSSNPSTKQFYSAWNSSKTLLSRGLIKGSGRPMYFYLTDEGAELANVLLKAEEGNMGSQENERQRGTSQREGPSNFLEPQAVAGSRKEKRSLDDSYEEDGDASCNKRIAILDGRKDVRRTSYESSPRGLSGSPARSQAERRQTTTHTMWKAKSFEVLLIVDTREIRSKSERDFFVSKLSELNIKVDTRALSVGDCIWIARNLSTKEEVVLDFVLERKRLDDLVESIKDGRFFEQKSRLSSTGINNVYYLIEEQSASDLGSFAESIKTAIATVIVGSKYFVRRCRDADETVAFLLTITSRIEKYYSSKDLLVVKARNLKGQADYKSTLNKYRDEYKDCECCFSYDTFQVMLNKSSLITVKELYIKMLMTTKGVSLEKALVIQKYFPTPRKLINAYLNLPDEKEKKMFMRNVTANEIGHKCFGPKLSEKIYENWGRETY